MKAVIPAAGFASRLRPLTDHCHKAMLPLGTTTMMALTLENLRVNGIRDVVVVTGYRAEVLKEYIHSIRGDINVEFIHNPDYASTNNAYSLSLTEPYISGSAFVLLDCDIVFEPVILKMVLDSKHSMALAVNKRNDLSKEEIKVYSQDGAIVDQITKEGIPQEAIGESIGIETFSPECGVRLFNVLQERIARGPGMTEFYEASFQELIDKKETLHIVDISGYRAMEVDFKSDLERAEREILPYLQMHNNG